VLSKLPFVILNNESVCVKSKTTLLITRNVLKNFRIDLKFNCILIYNEPVNSSLSLSLSISNFLCNFFHFKFVSISSHLILESSLWIPLPFLEDNFGTVLPETNWSLSYIWCLFSRLEFLVLMISEIVVAMIEKLNVIVL